MTLQTTEKQIAEAVIVQFDFSPDMAEAETLSSVTSIVSANQGDVGGSSNVTISNIALSSVSTKIAQCLVSGGTVGERYKLTAIVVTSAGQTLEADGYMRVRNL